MSIESAQHETPRARNVHRSLARLSGVLWLLVFVHLVVLMRREVWPFGPSFVAMCAAPPITPFMMLAWGKWGALFYTSLITMLAAGGWIFAARNPKDGFMLFLARLGLGVYWLSLDFGLAMSA